MCPPQDTFNSMFYRIERRKLLFGLCTETEKTEDWILINTPKQNKSIYNWVRQDLHCYLGTRSQSQTLASPTVSTLDEEFSELKCPETQSGELIENPPLVWGWSFGADPNCSIFPFPYVCFLLLLYSSFSSSFTFCSTCSLKHLSLFFFFLASAVSIILLPFCQTDPYQQVCFYSSKQKHLS